MSAQGVNPRFTVLGASGFVGSHLVPQLQARGWACEAPARGDETVFSRPLGHVIYAIGLTADFRRRPLETVDAHVCLLRRLLAEARFDTLTYLSSTRVYAGSGETHEQAALRVNPNDASDLYNLSKLMGESLCLHGGRPGARVARLSNIVGVRRDPDTFIDQLLAEGRLAGKIRLHTAWESRKDYLYIDDAVELITRIALAPEGGIYNVASGQGTSNREIADWLERTMGYSVSAEAGAPVWEFTNIDTDRIKRQFGFAPQPFSNYFPRFLQLVRQHFHSEGN